MKNRMYSVVFAVLFLVTLVAIPACRSASTDYRQDTYTYKTVDGCEIQADVYQPAGDEMRPVILWIHPGGFITGNRDWVSTEQVEMYLEAGYTVVAIDHRLAPEYKLETIVADVEAAYAWLVAEGPTLPDR
jgi:acetyl esterase/lipase